MTTIDDLPNELLDEIFAYLHAEIPFPKGRLVNTVCRRWNRPLVTTRLLLGTRVPVDVNLQLKCPKLLSLILPSQDMVNFQGHASLRELDLTFPCQYSDVPISYSYILSSCPRLTRLSLDTDWLSLFDDENIAGLLSLCQSLTHLDLVLIFEENVNEKMIKVLDDRNRRGLQGLDNLKSLVIRTSTPDLDLVTFCSVFRAPFLENLAIQYAFASVEVQSKVLSLFPNVRSIELENFLVQDVIDEIHQRVTDLKFSFANDVNLQSILNQFPNLVSLDTYDLIFDVIHLTRMRSITISQVNPSFDLSMFRCLQEFDGGVSSQTCNTLIRDLGLNCPQIVKLNLYQTHTGVGNLINPDFGLVTFPLLAHVGLSGHLVFNGSFTRFVSRHPKLESLVFISNDKHQEELTPSDLEMIQLHKLVRLTLKRIGAESVIPQLHWFLQNSPNLVHLTFEETIGNEVEIAFYCPNLKSLDFTGNFVSGQSLRKWTQTGNWPSTMSKLTLRMGIEPADIILLFKFLGTLSRLEYIKLILNQSRGESPQEGIYKNHLEHCPDEWKSIVMEYCDGLQMWNIGLPTIRTAIGIDGISVPLQNVIRKILPYVGARIIAKFHKMTD